jgi:hypothetical protein
VGLKPLGLVIFLILPSPARYLVRFLLVFLLHHRCSSLIWLHFQQQLIHQPKCYSLLYPSWMDSAARHLGPGPAWPSPTRLSVTILVLEMERAFRAELT